VSDSQTLRVQVTAIEPVTPLIKHFTLAHADGAALPAYSGGSHVIVVMRGANGRVHRNPYSLLSSPRDLSRYEIAVRRMEESRGGSRFMHDTLAVGSLLEIGHPVNLFPLAKRGRKHVLIAGGIGITPFLAQLEDLAETGITHELHYAARAPEHAAFLSRLQRRLGERLHVYFDSMRATIDYEALLARQPLGTHVYVCGPAGMIERVIATAAACGWSNSHVHWEQFSAPPPGEAFRAFLARAGISIEVEPDRSLLEAIEAAGIEVPYLCRGGVCGFCRTKVLEIDGELLHHDHYLSDAEKSGARTIMPCVSRARCAKLVLDL
jgi:ferredoxin-NADP reductase